MKFLSGCFGKVLLVILCVLLGVVLTLGGIAGAGYFILMTDGMMGTVEEKVNDTGAVTLEFSDEVRDMSVLNWAMGLGEIIGSISAEDGPTIGELEKYIGLDIISSTLADFLKLDQSVFQNASLVGEETGLAAVITSNMTMENVVEMVGGNILPDMPLFQEGSEFMTTPINEAFSSLTDYTIGDFITIEEGSAKIMTTLAGIKISEIADTVPTLPIGDFIDQGEDTHPVIKAISPLSINDLGTSKLTDTINGMKLSDILTGMSEDETNKVLYSLKDLTVGDLSGSEANNLVNGMFLGEIMDIDSSSNQALQTLQYSCINSQFVTLEAPGIIGDYAYVEGTYYKYLQENLDGSYYVAYYPETIEYTVAKSDENVNLYDSVHQNYGIVYKIYVPTASLTNGRTTINGIEFSAVVDENNEPIVEGEKSLVSAVLYVDTKCGKISEDGNTIKVKNRYHALYNSSGDYLFINGFDDEAYKGILLLPPSCIDSVVTDGEYLISLKEHKIADGKYLDFKATKEEDKHTIDATEYSVYKFHPLEGINETMNEITLGGVLTIDESSPRIMKSLKDTKITEMGSKIDTMPLGDMVDVGDSRILNSLAGTPLNKMSEAIDTLFLDELMEINNDSSRMIKALRYASLSSQTVNFVKTGLVQSGTASFLAASNHTYYEEREVEYYKNYVKQDSSVINRYYYAVSDNAITDAYVLYLTDADAEKETINPETSLTETSFYKIKPYKEDVQVYKDLTLLTPSASVNASVEGNAEILEAETAGNNYYYEVDGAGKITDTFVQSGTPVTDGDLTLVTHAIAYSRPQIGMSDKTNELVLSDVLDITPSSSKILKNLANKKVTRLGESIDTMTLGEMVDTGSSKLLSALADTTLNGLGDKVNTLFIDEIITIETDSSQMIKSLRYATLDSQIVYKDKTSLVQSDPTLNATITNYAQYAALETESYGQYTKSDSTVVNRYYYHITDSAIDEAYILYYTDKDLEKTSGSNTAFYKIKLYEQKEYSYVDLTTLTASENVNTTIPANNDIIAAQETGKVYYYATAADVITATYIVVYDGDTPVLDPSDSTKTKVYTVTDRHNRPMIGLSDKTNELTLGDVFSGENLSSGVLSLIDSNTKLNKISTAVAAAVQNSSVAILVQTGVIDSGTFTSGSFTSMAKERRAFIYNSTMTNMLNGMIDFIANPTTVITNPPYYTINDGPISPRANQIAGTTYNSLTALVEAYHQYDEVEFTGGAVTVHVDSTVDDEKWGVDSNNDSIIDYYAIPVFNIKGSNGITFNGTTKPIHLAIYNYTTTPSYSINNIGSHQAGYFYDPTNSFAEDSTNFPDIKKIG